MGKGRLSHVGLAVGGVPGKRKWWFDELICEEYVKEELSNHGEEKILYAPFALDKRWGVDTGTCTSSKRWKEDLLLNEAYQYVFNLRHSQYPFSLNRRRTLQKINSDVGPDRNPTKLDYPIEVTLPRWKSLTAEQLMRENG